MILSEIRSIFKCLINKNLIDINYYDKKDNKDNKDESYIELLFSDSYKLQIYTFWRIVDKEKVLAMDTERYLLLDFTAPEKDFQNLPFNESLLCHNINYIKSKYLNSTIEDVQINNTFDMYIKFNSDFILQAIINCRNNSFTYYLLEHNLLKLVEINFDWKE